MSALDVAGAVVWTLLTVLFAFAIFDSRTNDPGKVISLAFVVIFGLAATYCIARLFGAST